MNRLTTSWKTWFVLVGLGALAVVPRATFAQTPSSTPAAGYACDSASPMGTPTMEMPANMMASPDATTSLSFDQVYLDMMIPHHTTILAMAQAALPRLNEDRLTSIAQAVIDTQGPEIDELRGYRMDWFGSPDPMPMDVEMMSAISHYMPEAMTPEMATEMDPDALVATFCASADPDLAFIDLTIPHHQSAIAASQAALQQATHSELKTFAQRVIDSQQRETDQLHQIRIDLTGAATPAA